jgi:endonuclease-8
MEIDLIGYWIKRWWFAGKNLFVGLKKKGCPLVIIKTHFMMYGRILVNKSHPKLPNLKPQMQLVINYDGKDVAINWYFGNIKKVGSEFIKESMRMMRFDISHPLFDNDKMIEHLSEWQKKVPDDIMVDFLLNQDIFPGVGNILQQEALYRCKINPYRTAKNLTVSDMQCLIDSLREVARKMYSHAQIVHVDGIPEITSNTYLDNIPTFIIYHKAYCPLGHKTNTKYLGDRNRRTTWCPICQVD